MDFGKDRRQGAGLSLGERGITGQSFHAPVVFHFEFSPQLVRGALLPVFVTCLLVQVSLAGDGRVLQAVGPGAKLPGDGFSE